MPSMIENFEKNHHVLKHAKTPRFLGMFNHLEPFSKVLDPPEGQEQGGGAVGGQGRHQGVKL